MKDAAIYGGVEAGGTKFKCIVGSGPEDVVDRARIVTSAPAETLEQVIAFLLPHCRRYGISRVGIASFGPCDLNIGSPTYGLITSTPKPGWENTNIVGVLSAALEVDVTFDTDVNGAALGEYRWGATAGTRSSLYITIGTGIGGGLIVDGRPLHGITHPEMGHMFIRHDRARDPFPGSCPFHADCFEGLASGPAIEARFGRRGESLQDDDPFWELETDYIAEALSTYVLVVSPERIVMGGGIMQRDFILPRIRRKLVRLLAGYVRHAALTEKIDTYVLPPGLGQDSGVFGALALAMMPRLGK